MKYLRKLVLLTKEQSDYISSKAEYHQLGRGFSAIVRQIIQAKMDEEKAKEKKEE